MNHWIGLSIAYANQRSYLDDLFRVYPTIPEGIRDIDNALWERIKDAFNKKDNIALIESLLRLDLFPIKDSYVAYLRRDRGALIRNPATVARLCGRLYEMGLNKIHERATEPKETNRQIGPLFRRWLNSKSLGIEPVKLDEFISTKENAVLSASDAEMQTFARKHFNYTRNKGLDLIARFNGKYVMGEAKFLTDSGGHQNAQFNDAVELLKQKDAKAIPIAILDGVLYIKGRAKMHKEITGNLQNENIMSSLVLREFLYQL